MPWWSLLWPVGDGAWEGPCDSLPTVIVAGGLGLSKENILWGCVGTAGPCKPHSCLSGQGMGAIASGPVKGKVKFSNSISPLNTQDTLTQTSCLSRSLDAAVSGPFLTDFGPSGSLVWPVRHFFLVPTAPPAPCSYRPLHRTSWWGHSYTWTDSDSHPSIRPCHWAVIQSALTNIAWRSGAQNWPVLPVPHSQVGVLYCIHRNDEKALQCLGMPSGKNRLANSDGIG